VGGGGGGVEGEGLEGGSKQETDARRRRQRPRVAGRGHLGVRHGTSRVQGARTQQARGSAAHWQRCQRRQHARATRARQGATGQLAHVPPSAPQPRRATQATLALCLSGHAPFRLQAGSRGQARLHGRKLSVYRHAPHQRQDPSSPRRAHL
jgi:hypothetical protein